MITSILLYIVVSFIIYYYILLYKPEPYMLGECMVMYTMSVFWPLTLVWWTYLKISGPDPIDKPE